MFHAMRDKSNSMSTCTLLECQQNTYVTGFIFSISYDTVVMWGKKIFMFVWYHVRGLKCNPLFTVSCLLTSLPFALGTIGIKLSTPISRSCCHHQHRCRIYESLWQRCSPPKRSNYWQMVKNFVYLAMYAAWIFQPSPVLAKSHQFTHFPRTCQWPSSGIYFHRWLASLFDWQNWE